MLDTAASYGASECLIGSYEEADAFEIVTKTLSVHPAETEPGDLAAIDSAFRASLDKLRRRRVAALLVHSAGNLAGRGGAALWAQLERYRRDGLAGKIGVSVYNAAEAEELMARFPIEIVQLPLNVFDQRPLRSGALERLASNGIIIHARSALLQGLLLMQADELPPALRAARPAVERWQAACVAADVSPLAAALGFVLGAPGVSAMVFGVHSRDHLAQCIAAIQQPVHLPWEVLACDSPLVVDPRRWTGMTGRDR
jgi:aryl-alcohol dehydrogenase-like predicted oxidoreductase